MTETDKNAPFKNAPLQECPTPPYLSQQIVPNWPLPAGVRALVTTRQGGGSSGVYSANNLGDHVGDNPQTVADNRRLLRTCVPGEPHWLTQIHGTSVYSVPSQPVSPPPQADASYSHRAQSVCAVLTADCLPVLLCSETGDEVAAVHAGWRGLADGVISQTVRHFRCGPGRLRAFLGPAISVDCFQVRGDVLVAFQRAAQHRTFADPVETAFIAQNNGHYLADLYALARSELKGLGVEQIYGGDFCTFTDTDRFFSYRRDGVTGRMASLIWIE